MTDNGLFTILLVDDMATNIQTLSSILKDSYKIKVAANGKKAIEIANMDNKPDLILLDVVMPEMDGYEVCRRLKSNIDTFEIPIIFVTAKDDGEDEERGFLVGAVDYITKPFRPSTILARVKTHLELKQNKLTLKSFNQTLTQQVENEIAKRMLMQKHYKELFESSPIPIFIHPMLDNRPAKIEDVNDAACLLTGYTKQELLQIEPITLHPKGVFEELMPYAKKLQNGEPVQFETDCLSKNGTIMPILIRAVPFSFDGNFRVYSYWTELSYIKKVENEKRLKDRLLIQQSKLAAMGEMIGAIGHQWRQPLNYLAIIIQDTLQAFQYGELDERYITKFKTDGMETIQIMSKTIDDFRNFFSPNKKEDFFYLEDALLDTLKILAAQFKNNNIDIQFEVNEESKHKYLCYKNELNQVILNIMVNAKDALIEKKIDKKFVSITIEDDDGYTICIEDSAGGISPKIQEHIFDPYFTTKEEGKGTGIGLYMSKTIIEEHLGGKLEVQNSKNGAKFLIKLPYK